MRTVQLNKPNNWGFFRICEFEIDLVLVFNYNRNQIKL